MHTTIHYKEILNQYVDTHDSGVGLFQLGLMHFYGHTYPKNTHKAVTLLKQAGKTYPHAYTFLGKQYLSGDVIEANQKRGFFYLHKAARLNDTDAFLYLSQMYIDKEQSPQNTRKVLEWLHKASQNNSSEALLHLGIIHLGAPFQEPDYTKALSYFTQSHALDNPHAPAFLGTMYENGYGVNRNLKQAFQYYLKGAAKDSPVAHICLGRMYANGVVAKKNVNEAIHHFEMAQKSDFLEASLELASLYLQKNSEVYDFEKGFSLLLKLYKKQSSEAAYRLGMMYLLGDGVTQNPQKAIKYLKSIPSPESYLILGRIYYQGKWVEQNILQALNYFKLGAQADSSECMFNAAELIINEHIPESFKYLLEDAIDFDNTDAMTLLGHCYQYGIRMRKNRKKGIALLENAAQKKHPKANRILGQICIEGDGVTKDMNKGISYLEESIRLGDLAAPLILGFLYMKDKKVGDLNKAKYYFTMGKENQHPEAYFFLGLITLQENETEGMQLIEQAVALGSESAKTMYNDLVKKV